MKRIDLHTHSTFSDGTLTPAQLVEEAVKNGISALAVTDHDTYAGIFEAAEAAEKSGIDFVPGIEISSRYDRAIHVLGYYIDPTVSEAAEKLHAIVDDRDRRNREICAQMAADGLPVTYEMMQQRYGTSIGRPHFAELCVEFGLAKSIDEAFSELVERGKRYYAPRNIVPFDEAIKVIVTAKGVPVIAHPFQYKMTDSGLRELIEYGIGIGLKGLECRYSGYTTQQEDYLESLAEEYGLLKTGGSDFHGAHKPHIALGNGTKDKLLEVPYEWYLRLKEAAGK